MDDRELFADGRPILQLKPSFLIGVIVLGRIMNMHT